MSTGHIQGKLLEFISMMIKPLNILEIGTFTGYSAICLSKGLQDGGKLITIELNDELADFARSYFVRAGAGSKIIQMNGKAQEIIPGLDLKFDLAFIDGDKREYCEYFRAVYEKVRPGGFILADNVLWGGQAMEMQTTDPQAKGIIEFNEMIRTHENIDKLIIPIRDGLTLIMKRS
jgi:predicted O-methyltransferase YrrM